MRDTQETGTGQSLPRLVSIFMMFLSRSTTSRAAVALLAAVLPAGAQDTAATLAKARAAIADKRPGDAVILADSVVRTKPDERDAYAVKIEAYLSAKERDIAFNVYEAFTKTTRRQSAALLAPIARDVLREYSTKESGGTAVPALEHLARAGDAAGRSALQKMASRAENPDPAATDALARLGDRGAQQGVRKRLASPSAGERASAITLLAKVAPDAVRPSLGTFAEERDLDVQLAAIQAIEDLQATEYTPELKRALEADVPLVRLSAAAALVRLGDAAGTPLMERALKSEVGDARLIAAHAFSNGPTSVWAPSVRSMLGPHTEIVRRLEAASLLLETDRAKAMAVIADATRDPNPAVRDRATRVLAADPKADVAVLWPLLRDDSPWVKIAAAGKLLELSGSPDSPPAAAPAKAAPRRAKPAATPAKKPGA